MHKPPSWLLLTNQPCFRKIRSCLTTNKHCKPVTINFIYFRRLFSESSTEIWVKKQKRKCRNYSLRAWITEILQASRIILSHAYPCAVSPKLKQHALAQIANSQLIKSLLFAKIWTVMSDSSSNRRFTIRVLSPTVLLQTKKFDESRRKSKSVAK
jgi:hypothetical protein